MASESEISEKKGLRFTIRQAQNMVDRVKDHFKDGGPQSLRDKYFPTVEKVEGLIAEAKKVLEASKWDKDKYEAVSRKIKEAISGAETIQIKNEIKYSPPEGRWPGGEGYQATHMKNGRNKDINEGVNQDANSIFHGIGRRRKTRKTRRRKTRRH